MPQIFEILSETGDEPFSPQKPIVRYMRLPSFFLLLRGRVFIPSIKELQRSDPFEAQVPTKCVRNYEIELRDLLYDHFAWLFECAEAGERNYIEANRSTFQRGVVSVLSKIWLRELAVRRCVWCWHASSTESMGLWHRYGNHGIAIESTVERVRRALQIAAPVGTSCGLVRYTALDPNRADKRMLSEQWLKRPYYWKLNAYAYEHEFRALFECHPEAVSAGGIMMEVDTETLIQRVIYSPHFFRSEAVAIAKIVRDGVHNRNWPQELSGLLDLDQEEPSPFIETIVDRFDEFFARDWAGDTLASRFERPEELFGTV